jgi:pimeloyl-ACP methyl ester carboxylesterase
MALPPIPPIWREGMMGLEYRSLRKQAIYASPPEAAASLPIMLIPGFLTGDASLRSFENWLQRCGHRTHASGMRLNADCSEASVGRLEQRLQAFVESQGEPAVVIGQSRGGCFARVLGVRHPDLVRSVITLGSPHVAPLAVHPLVWAQAATLAGLSVLGVPGLASHRCTYGECCRNYSEDLRAPMPRGVDFVSIYSERDGIVDWRACLDPEAEHVKVDSTHCGMGLNAAVYEAMDEILHRRQAHRARRSARAGKQRAASKRRSAAATA